MLSVRNRGQIVTAVSTRANIWIYSGYLETWMTFLWLVDIFTFTLISRCDRLLMTVSCFCLSLYDSCVYGTHKAGYLCIDLVQHLASVVSSQHQCERSLIFATQLVYAWERSCLGPARLVCMSMKNAIYRCHVKYFLVLNQFALAAISLPSKRGLLVCSSKQIEGVFLCSQRLWRWRAAVCLKI